MIYFIVIVLSIVNIYKTKQKKYTGSFCYGVFMMILIIFHIIILFINFVFFLIHPQKFYTSSQFFTNNNNHSKTKILILIIIDFFLKLLFLGWLLDLASGIVSFSKKKKNQTPTIKNKKKQIKTENKQIKKEENKQIKKEEDKQIKKEEDKQIKKEEEKKEIYPEPIFISNYDNRLNYNIPNNYVLDDIKVVDSHRNHQ